MLGSRPPRAGGGASSSPLSPAAGGRASNHGQPLRLLQPDPRAGRARARASGGQRVGFQREPLGTSVERADAAASHGPGAPAARPPPRLQLPPPPTQRGWGRGERHVGHRPRSDSRDTARPPQKPPDRHHFAPAHPPSEGPAKGGMFARIPGVSITGKRPSPRPFPAGLAETLPSPTARPPNGFLLQRPLRMEVIREAALRPFIWPTPRGAVQAPPS